MIPNEDDEIVNIDSSYLLPTSLAVQSLQVVDVSWLPSLNSPFSSNDSSIQSNEKNNIPAIVRLLSDSRPAHTNSLADEKQSLEVRNHVTNEFPTKQP